MFSPVEFVGLSTPNKKKKSSGEENPCKVEREVPLEDVNPKWSAIDASSRIEMQTKGKKTLKNAVKLENKRKK